MSCRGCKYWRSLAIGKAGYYACHYMIDTKHMRGCDPDECDKKESGKKKNKRWRSTFEEGDT